MSERTDIAGPVKDDIHGCCMIRVELDDDGKPSDLICISANENLARMENLSLEGLVGHRFSEVFPHGNERWLEFCYRAACLGESLSTDNISVVEGMYMHAEAYPSDRSGYCICVLHDIRESVFEKLREKEKLEELVKAYEEEKERNTLIRHYLKALGIVYPLVISIDYTSDSYSMVEYDNFHNKSSPYSGTVEELVSVGASTIPDSSVAEAFTALFSRTNAVREFRSGKKELSLRHPQNSDDGKVHYMDTHIICTECTPGKVTAICVAKCIDDEAERDRAMQQAQEHAAVINALSTIYTTIIEADLVTHGYKIIQTSSPIESVMDGKARGNFDDVMEKVLEYFIHPDDIERMRAFVDLSTVAERMGSDTSLVAEYRAPYGRWFEARFIAKNRDGNGKVISSIYAARDVTPEKLKELNYRAQLEEQLMISNTLARSFRNVYLVDLEKETARILKLDAGYDRLEKEGVGHEFSFNVLLSDWLNNVVAEEDRAETAKVFDVENVRKRLSTENEFTGNYRSTAGGETHYFQYNMSRVDENGRKAILGFQSIDDIIRIQLEAERKRSEIERVYREKLQTAADEAERANKTKTEFLLRMSHDIRTPLNGIRGMLDIADHFDGDDEKQRDCRTKIRESSNILMELINEVLDMSKLESGEVVLERVPFDIMHISGEILTVIEKMAQEMDIEVVRNCSLEHTSLIGSPVHYKRLVLNILSNAIKYNRPHGKVWFTSREVSFDGRTTVIETTIRDTGIGMSEEFQKHLFEPFQQENAGVRTKYGGTGLGMSIAKNLTQKMGGTMSFESKKDVGTTFTIQIPFEVDFSVHTGASQDEEENVSIEGVTVILAEDNDLNLEIARFLLQTAGAYVIEARNGEEAVSEFSSSKPGEISAILMDIMMPVMDGYEATRRIRAMDRKDASTIPIIAMTANAFVEDRIATKKAGMNAHIAKPLNAKNVIRIISEEIKAAGNADRKE
jgi:signal transduction histidine kinase/CheY-like chemotaxis protein